MKADVISDTFTVGDPILISSKTDVYYNKLGIVERISSAGDIIYIHCRLKDVNTVLTYREFQICKLDAKTMKCEKKGTK